MQKGVLCTFSAQLLCAGEKREISLGQEKTMKDSNFPSSIIVGSCR